MADEPASVYDLESLQFRGMIMNGVLQRLKDANSDIVDTDTIIKMAQGVEDYMFGPPCKVPEKEEAEGPKPEGELILFPNLSDYHPNPDGVE